MDDTAPRYLKLPKKTVEIPDRTFANILAARLPRVSISMPALPWETTNKDADNANG